MRERRYETWGNDWNNTELPFRQVKAHIPAYIDNSEGVREILVPVRQRRDIKFLVMVRNPQDVFLSVTKFVPTHSEKWYRYWGNYPRVNVTVDLMIEKAKTSMHNFLVFHFFQTWYEYKDEPNVLLLHYSDVFKDQRKYVKKIADFIGVSSITEEALDEVLERVSVQFMKKRNDKYRHLAGRNQDLYLLKDPRELGGLVREGGVNKSKKAFTEEQLTAIHRIGVDTLGQEMAKTLELGFDAS